MWLHVIRVPAEIVFSWLFVYGLVSQMMTFEGWNFDIFTGMLASVVAVYAIRGRSVTHRWVLVGYNILGLVLLANIVTIAALSLPSSMQQLNFDVPNRGVLLFPYIWLPTLVVPIVLFAHLSSFWQLLT